MTLTMNHTFYAPRTDIAIGFQHPFMNQPATTTNFIYFKMMQTPSSSVVQQHSLTTTVVQQQEVSGESASSQIPSKTKGKEHSSSQSNQQDSMEDDNDDDWIDVDEDDNVVPSKPKSKHFYFRHSEDSDDESDEEDEEDEDEEMDEDDEFVDDTIEIPFWYGNEDPKHIEFVMKEYSSFLQLNKDRKPNSRIPIRFIGKIVREALEDTVISVRDEDSEDAEDADDSVHMQRVLITSETIYIYQKSVQSPELCCKFDTSITVQTFYDYEEGIPISILIQPETEWDISTLDNVTLLECFPSFGLDPYTFEYGSHRVADARQILPHSLETSLGNAGLFNQCLQNSAGYLAKLKPKQNEIQPPKAE